MYKYVSASGLNSCAEMDLGDFFFCKYFLKRWKQSVFMKSEASFE